MAERAQWPATACGDELRRIVNMRKENRRRARIGIVCALVGGCCLLTAAWQAPLLLVWNVSESVPRGLYWVTRGAPVERGDMVIARLPEGAALFAARRRYLPLGVPLVKRVAGTAGDRICAQGPTIRLNGWRVAVRRSADAHARPLPWRNGCGVLGANDYFLLGNQPSSFDGRYFGIIKHKQIIGRATLLWRG